MTPSFSIRDWEDHLLILMVFYLSLKFVFFLNINRGKNSIVGLNFYPSKLSSLAYLVGCEVIQPFLLSRISFGCTYIFGLAQ